jgi:hypothetical protein
MFIKCFVAMSQAQKFVELHSTPAECDSLGLWAINISLLRSEETNFARVSKAYRT